MALKRITDYAAATIPLAGTEIVELDVAGAPRKVAVSDLRGSTMSNPMTTTGDMIIGGASGAPTRLAAGTNAYVMTMVGGSPAWAASGSSTPNVQTVTSAATVTPTYTNDLVEITAQAAALTIANPTGTPANGWGMVIDLIDNGTSRALTWGSKYANRMANLPAATTAGKRHRIGVEYNAADDKLYCMFAQVQP